MSKLSLILGGCGLLYVLVNSLIIYFQRKKITKLKKQIEELETSVETYKNVLSSTNENAQKTVNVVKKIKELENEETKNKTEYQNLESGNVDARLSALNG